MGEQQELPSGEPLVESVRAQFIEAERNGVFEGHSWENVLSWVFQGEDLIGQPPGIMRVMGEIGSLLAEGDLGKCDHYGGLMRPPELELSGLSFEERSNYLLRGLKMRKELLNTLPAEVVIVVGGRRAWLDFDENLLPAQGQMRAHLGVYDPNLDSRIGLGDVDFRIAENGVLHISQVQSGEIKRDEAARLASEGDEHGVRSYKSVMNRVSKLGARWRRVMDQPQFFPEELWFDGAPSLGVEKLSVLGVWKLLRYKRLVSDEALEIAWPWQNYWGFHWGGALQDAVGNVVAAEMWEDGEPAGEWEELWEEQMAEFSERRGLLRSRYESGELTRKEYFKAASLLSKGRARRERDLRDNVVWLKLAERVGRGLSLGEVRGMDGGVAKAVLGAVEAGRDPRGIEAVDQAVKDYGLENRPYYSEGLAVLAHGTEVFMRTLLPYWQLFERVSHENSRIGRSFSGRRLDLIADHTLMW